MTSDFQMEWSVLLRSQCGTDYREVVQLCSSARSLIVGETVRQRSMPRPGGPGGLGGPGEAEGHGTSRCRLRLELTCSRDDMERALSEDRVREA